MKSVSLFLSALCLSTAAAASPASHSQLSGMASMVLPKAIILPNAPFRPRLVTESDFGLYLLCVPGHVPGGTFTFMRATTFIEQYGSQLLVHCQEGRFIVSW